MLLSTSEKSGFCYIKTKNIDGETNLKNKQSNPKLKKKIKTDEDISKLKYICIYINLMQLYINLKKMEI